MFFIRHMPEHKAQHQTEANPNVHHHHTVWLHEREVPKQQSESMRFDIRIVVNLAGGRTRKGEWWRALGGLLPSHIGRCSLRDYVLFPAAALAPRKVPGRYSLDHLLNAWVSDCPNPTSVAFLEEVLVRWFVKWLSRCVRIHLSEWISGR